MTTEKGLLIANEMRQWLCNVYDVHEVVHDGSLYELPALLEAQRISRETGEPVL
jgi:hypothetical protein